MKTDIHFFHIAEFFSEWELFQTKFEEKIETPTLCSVTLFVDCIAVYEVMWRHIVEKPDRPRMTIWRKRIACWITKATETYSEYVILIAFPLLE
jgi:hypothetical protein